MQKKAIKRCSISIAYESASGYTSNETIAGAGHEWPGAAQQTLTVDANSVMWAFFLAHPLP